VDLLRILAAPEVPTNELNPEQLDLDLEPRLPKRVFAAEAIEQENEEAADLAWSEHVLFRGVTRAAINMMERRLRLTQAARQAAAEAKRQKREFEKWQRSLPSNGCSPVSAVQQEPAIESTYRHQPDDLTSAGIVSNLLAGADETITLLDRLIASGQVTGELLAAAETHAARTRSLAEDARRRWRAA